MALARSIGSRSAPGFGGVTGEGGLASVVA